MDWKDMLYAWLVEYVQVFSMICMFMAGTIALAGRYTIRTNKAFRTGNIFGIVWNALMLAIVLTFIVFIATLWYESPNQYTVSIIFTLSLVLYAISLLPAYFYNRWMGEGLQEMMWFPVVPAFMFFLLVNAPIAFIILAIFFIAMYAYGRSQSYRDGSMLRDYLIDRSRDYYGRKARRR